MSSNRPVVSVCVPVYEGERFLGACLDSVLAQTVDDIEVLVLDDDSHDGSVALAERYAAADPRVQVLRNPRRLGLAGNWNRCVELAAGEWVKFVFQDDAIAPICLERMLEGGSAEWPIVACGRRYRFEDVDEAARDEYRQFEAELAPDRLFGGRSLVPAAEFRRVALDHFGFNVVGEPTAVLLHRSVFDRHGRFDEQLVEICDLEFWLRVGSVHGVRFVDEELAEFRVHGAGTTARNRRDHSFRTEMDQLVLLHQLAFAPAFAALRADARRHQGGTAGARFGELAVDSWVLARQLDAAGDPTAMATWRDIVRRYPRVSQWPRVRMRRARRHVGWWRTRARA
ncbi:MAG: hypothetical protein QOJ67_3819 [Acidimicrobiaceae bacterium]